MFNLLRFYYYFWNNDLICLENAYCSSTIDEVAETTELNCLTSTSASMSYVAESCSKQSSPVTSTPVQNSKTNKKNNKVKKKALEQKAGNRNQELVSSAPDSSLLANATRENIAINNSETDILLPASTLDITAACHTPDGILQASSKDEDSILASHPLSSSSLCYDGDNSFGHIQHILHLECETETNSSENRITNSKLKKSDIVVSKSNKNQSAIGHNQSAEVSKNNLHQYQNDNMDNITPDNGQPGEVPQSLVRKNFCK